MKKVGLALFLVFGLLANSWATIITFEYDFVFSGDPPAGSTPWLTATFDDGGSPGAVELTMATGNLTGVEFVTGWYFNLDPAINPTLLNIAYDSGQVASSVSTGTDAFQADGDGLYDILFQFPTSNAPNPDPNLDRFRANESSVYNFTLAGLTANSFNFESTIGGGAGTFLSAAHVQGIGTDGEGSGWVAPGNGAPPIPEPGTLILLGAGLVGLALAMRRSKP